MQARHGPWEQTGCAIRLISSPEQALLDREPFDRVVQPTLHAWQLGRGVVALPPLEKSPREQPVQRLPPNPGRHTAWRRVEGVHACLSGEGKRMVHLPPCTS